MKQFIYLLGLCLVANFLSAYTPLENIRVVDGDTIRAEAKGKEIKIRLVEIDAPEMNQPFGAQSKNFLNGQQMNFKIFLIIFFLLNVIEEPIGIFCFPFTSVFYIPL